MRILCAAYARGVACRFRSYGGGRDRYFFKPLSIKTLLLTSNTRLQTVTFSSTLNQNATFDLEHGAPDHDFFISLSIKTLLLTTSTGLQTVTFQYPSKSKCYF